MSAAYPEHLREQVERHLRGLRFSHEPLTAGLEEAMRYSLLAGGKRIRPVLALATARAVGLQPQEVLPLAGAIELIHTYSLIHDDLPAMDDDELRRGMPTCHVKYGEDVAILAGDGLYAEAFKHLLTAQRSPPERVLGAAAELAAATGVDGMVGGQYADVMLEAARDSGGPGGSGDSGGPGGHGDSGGPGGSGDPGGPGGPGGPGASGGPGAAGNPGGAVASEGPGRLRRVHELKTGRLIGASVICVLILSGTDGHATMAYRRFAAELGVLFQIVDDILDVTGTDQALGKPRGSDERHGKRTYVSEYGMQQALRLAAESHATVREALAQAAQAGAGAGAGAPGAAGSSATEELGQIADFIYTRTS